VLIQSHNHLPQLKSLPRVLENPESPSPSPAPPVDEVSLQTPPEAPSPSIQGPRPGEPTPPSHGWVYKGARFLVGSAGAVVGGAIGTAIGGVIHAGDTVIPEKLQRCASKILRPSLAAIGAGVGLYAGLGVPLLGPAKGAMLGAVLGAVVGGSIPGALDALAASGKGAICGGWKGRKKGYDLAATAFDKVAAKLQSPPSEPPPPPPPASR